jgi:putative polyhydroxyalkanoic acid system protein
MAGAALPSRPLELPMSKPLVVSIPHQLGKDEAIRRLKGGLGQLKEKTDGKLAAVEDSWSDNRADFRLAVLGQTASGNLEVLEDSVRLEVQLPWLLAMVAEKVRPLIEKQGHLMLEKK